MAQSPPDCPASEKSAPHVLEDYVVAAVVLPAVGGTLGFDCLESAELAGKGQACKDDESGAAALQSRPWLTMEMKTLGISASLFATITLCQLFGAIMANSQALMVDCISMGIDAGTMVGNMCAEGVKGSRWHKAAELVVGAVSLLALTALTVNELVESIRILEEGGHGGEQVHPWIVMAFALAGLVFDGVSLAAFRRSHKKNRSGRELNMWTALLHVGADVLRSTTTLCLSIAILIHGEDSVSMDAWASLGVGSTILVGAAGGIVGWIRSLAKYLRAISRDQP